MEMHRLFRHILAPVDGTESSINAGQVAIQIAATLRCELVFMYVVDTRAAEDIAASTSKTLAGVCRELEDKARRYLEYLTRLAVSQGVEPQRVVRQGMPHVEITEWARAGGVDLIVIGRVGGEGTQRLARIGSVAERVIEYAHCPVLTVRYKPGRF